MHSAAGWHKFVLSNDKALFLLGFVGTPNTTIQEISLKWYHDSLFWGKNGCKCTTSAGTGAGSYSWNKGYIRR